MNQALQRCQILEKKIEELEKNAKNSLNLNNNLGQLLMIIEYQYKHDLFPNGK